MSGNDPTPPALEVVGVDKWFGPVHANRAVSFAVARGHIHGVVGENGAGKSTIMNLVYGYLAADAGEIRLDGAPLAIRSPADAIAHGIGMVHQHFTLVDTFTGIENALLGLEGGPLLAAGAERARRELTTLAETHGLSLDLDRPVGELSVGERQRLEILKTLHRGARIVILDEPTAALTPGEADRLFDLARALADQGRTIIIITHKLREIMAATDRVTVMRRGTVVATLDTADTSPDRLAALMVGRETPPSPSSPTPPKPPGGERLRVEGLRVTDDAGRERVRDLNLSIRAGEIVGVAGVSGNGQSELLEALAGIRAPSAGTVSLDGEAIVPGTMPWNPKTARERGVVHVPEDRHRMGMVGSAPALETSILGYQNDPAWNRRWRLDWRRVREKCVEAMGLYDTRPADPDLPSALFSGGNQQKIVMAREVERNPRLALIGQPTRGVDVGAIAFIHRRLRELRDAGTAILLVSVELDELLALSDRIVVMCDGRVMGEVAVTGADREEGREGAPQGDRASPRIRLGAMMAGLAAE